MNVTYDLNQNGCLIITADPREREALKQLANEQGEFTANAEYEALESLLANSELEWIQPKEIGVLTAAPILGIRGKERKVTKQTPQFAHIVGHWDGHDWWEPVEAAWGFMDYQVRSFITDLIETGKAVFIS